MRPLNAVYLSLPAAEFARASQAPAQQFFAITGSFTVEGLVAWRTSAGQWSRDVADAGVEIGIERRDAILQEAAQQGQKVCDVYAVELGKELTPDGVTRFALPSARERMRALGPTTPFPGSTQAPLPAASPEPR